MVVYIHIHIFVNPNLNKLLGDYSYYCKRMKKFFFKKLYCIHTYVFLNITFSVYIFTERREGSMGKVGGGKVREDIIKL